jgi:outer membrane lipoprotein-sorting protein
MNHKIITPLLIIASLLTIAWTDSFEGIRAAAGKIESIEADFVQEKHMRILARPLISKGHFVYKTPASLRWEYRHPMQRVMLMHNGNVRRFLHSEKGWEEDTANNPQAMDFVLQEISRWLNGRFDENPMFKASLAPGNKIVLTPKESGMDQFIQRIEMIMADQPGIMKEVLIFESADSYTRFKFITPKINQPLAEAVFQKVQ